MIMTMLDQVDTLIIGGGLTLTFIRARVVEIDSSGYDKMAITIGRLWHWH